MFTAARLVAALCMAGLGWLGSDYVRTLMPESTAFGYFNFVNLAVGFFCGWIIIGPRAGRGMSSAISHGITGTVAMIFWALFLQSANEMTRLAMRHRYDGPVEALGAIFEIGVGYGSMLVNGGFILLMIAGALTTGILSEITSRHWR
ncbi:TrgA family protein [Salipiger sp.]|uniref:TrgA family protein n=1 Tax=Salipiger sp. TaxID=2078585 RepID=UPI003A96F44F